MYLKVEEKKTLAKAEKKSKEWSRRKKYTFFNNNDGRWYQVQRGLSAK